MGDSFPLFCLKENGSIHINGIKKKKSIVKDNIRKSTNSARKNKLKIILRLITMIIFLDQILIFVIRLFLNFISLNF